MECVQNDSVTYFVGAPKSDASAGAPKSDAFVAYPRLELGSLLWEKNDRGRGFRGTPDLKPECAEGNDGISSKTAAQGSNSAFFSPEDGLALSPSSEGLEVVAFEAREGGFGTAKDIK